MPTLDVTRPVSKQAQHLVVGVQQQEGGSKGSVARGQRVRPLVAVRVPGRLQALDATQLGVKQSLHSQQVSWNLLKWQANGGAAGCPRVLSCSYPLQSPQHSAVVQLSLASLTPSMMRLLSHSQISDISTRSDCTVVTLSACARTSVSQLSN